MSTSDTRVNEEISDLEEPSTDAGRVRVGLEIAIALTVLAGIYFLFAPQEEIELPPLAPQEIDPIIRAQIDAAEEQAPSATTQESAPEEALIASPVNAAQAAVEQPFEEGEAARQLISGLRDGSLSLTDEELLAQAVTYADNNATSDVYLLLFYAARQGNGQAAFELASLYDPAHFRSGSSLLQAPDAFQAHKWYSKAAKQEIPGAESRLQALRTSVQTAAAGGDAAAQRLLLNWQ
jgi:TPR repeat protein